MRRRNFLGAGAAAIGMSELLSAQVLAEVKKSIEPTDDPVPRRTLGATGEKLSVIGLGGFALVRLPQDECNNLVAEAVDRGMNYVDIAPTYGPDNEAERKMGIAMKPYRDKIFLACKTQNRDKAGALKEMKESLQRLKTDHFDLYQMHAIRDVEKDVERGLQEDGAMAGFDEAKKEGIIRYLGFSSHSVQASLRAIESGRFDTILHPVNFVCHYEGVFDQAPIAAAKKKNMGLLALKAMARTRWGKGVERTYKNCWYEPVDDPVLAAMAVRWTLGQGIHAAIPPADHNLFRMAMNVVSKEQPLANEETEALKTFAGYLNPIFSGPEAATA